MPQFNPFQGSLERIARAAVSGTLTPETEQTLIAQARRYARKHNLPFDGTMPGVLKLAGEADRTIRDHQLKLEHAEAVRKAREFAGHRKKLFEMG